MPFLLHLDELRKRLFLVVGVLSVAMIALYFFTEPIYAFVVAPVVSILKGAKPIAIGVLDPMTVKFGLAFWSAVVLCSPLIAWQVMAFLLPALKPKERRWVLPTFFAMVVLFASGVVFCYLIILPASFAWLADQAGTIMTFTPTAGDLLLVVEFFLLGFGVAFQTPVVVFYLVYFGVVPYAKLRSNWRIIYVTIVILAAMITPDWSPVSMGALSVAMIVLYELSMLACRVVLAKKIKAQKAAEAAERGRLMHEMGITQEVLARRRRRGRRGSCDAHQQRDADRRRADRRRARLAAVRVGMPDPGGTFAEGAVLEVRETGGRSLCLQCGVEFDHDRFDRRCTACGSFATQVIQGDELRIDDIDVDLPEADGTVEE